MKKLFMCAGLLAISLSSHAVPLTTLLNGGSITAGGTVFDQWGVLFEDRASGIAVNTDNIEVTVLTDGGFDPGQGLRFDILNDEFFLAGEDPFNYMDFMFGFRVSVIDNTLIKDNSLYLTDSQLANTSSLASVFIEEMIYADDTLVDLFGVKTVEHSDVFGQITEKRFDSANFAPVSSVYVTKNILLEAWDIGESANLLSFEQRFSRAVSAPASLLFFTAGLVTLGAIRKRKNAAKVLA